MISNLCAEGPKILQKIAITNEQVSEQLDSIATLKSENKQLKQEVELHREETNQVREKREKGEHLITKKEQEITNLKG